MFFMAKKLSVLLLILFAACSTWTPKRVISIGIDPTFVMSPIGNKQASVYAFTNELLEVIFQNTPFNIRYVTLSYDNMVDHVDNCKVDFIVSSLSQTLENREQFNYTSMFLSLGDVFVTRLGASSLDYRNFTGKLIAIEDEPFLLTLFSGYPMINLTYYNYIPQALEDIVTMKIDGAIIPYILLSSHLSPEYRSLLKINPTKLTSRGLYLLSLNDRCNVVKQTFNKKLARLIDTGAYEKLLEKWGLIL